MRKYLIKSLHSSIHSINTGSLNHFNMHLDQLISEQVKCFSEITNSLSKIPSTKYEHFNKLSYEEFTDRIPISSYSNYENIIIEQMQSKKDLICQNVNYYQPTSGTTSRIKWIPFNKLFVKQINRAANTWLADLYTQYPEIKNGQHYWSLSWLPQDLRGNTQIDDSKLFPWYKRILMNNIMAVNPDIAYLENLEQSRLATAIYLCSQQNLTLISVWSPTFLLGILKLIEEKKEQIIYCLKNGQWFDNSINIPVIKNTRAASMLERYSGPELYQRIWPNLRLISSWDTSSSASYAQKLQDLFPAVAFQGKGLWATEGVVTIPIRGKHLLAYQSHFYEFENLENSKILLSWQLEKGMSVSPIISSGNGMLRYKLDDELFVKGFEGQCPELEFRGRLKSVDIVGEKIDYKIAQEIISKLADEFSPICLVAVKFHSSLPKYYLLVNNSQNQHIHRNLFEETLAQYFHYRLARESSQLERAEFLFHENPLQIYFEICKNKNMIEGNIKIEPIIELTEEEFNHAFKK